MKTRPGPDPVALACFLLLFLLTGLFIATILLGSVPPVDRDALTHHLFVPKLWLQHGGIYEIPEIPFSYYPMNLDLLYTIPLYFGNDIIPKYIHYFFALATALLLYRHLAKRLGTQYGLLGALFFLSVPIIFKLSITVYVDLGVVFFTTAALLLLLHWAEKDFQIRYLVLAGLCCGLAAGTKYNGLIAIIALTLLVPILYQQQNALKEQQSNGKALLWGVVFTVVTLASFAPWLIRNYAWTGNPIYPLHNALFQKLRSPDIAEQSTESVTIADTLQQITSQGSNAFITRRILYNEPWWHALLLPIRFFYEGKDDNPQFFDGKLSPFLLVLPILAFLFRTPGNQRREQKFLLSFALLYFFFTFFQEAMRVRYIVPIVPPLIILSMYGLEGTLQRTSVWFTKPQLKKIACLAIAVCIPCSMLWYNAQYVFGQFAAINPLPYLHGDIGRDAYITTYRPEYPAIQYANAVLLRDTKVLCIFLGNRGYYMDFQPIFEQPFGSGVFSKFLAMQKSEKSIIDEMRQKKITHVLLRDDLALSWFKQLNDADKLQILPLLEQASKPLFSKNGHTLFRMEDKARSSE